MKTIEQFEKAIEEANTEKLKKLLDANPGANVNARIENGDTLLHIAVKCSLNKSNIVKLLLVAGAEVDELNTAEKTPLYYAGTYNYTDVMNVLINYGADFYKNAEVYKSQGGFNYLYMNLLPLNTPEHVYCFNDIITLRSLVQNDETLKGNTESIVGQICPTFVRDAAKSIKNCYEKDSAYIALNAVLMNLSKLANEIHKLLAEDNWIKDNILNIRKALEEKKEEFKIIARSKEKEFATKWIQNLGLTKEAPKEKELNEKELEEFISQNEGFPLLKLPNDLIKRIGYDVYNLLANDECIINEKGFSAGDAIIENEMIKHYLQDWHSNLIGENQ